MGIGPVTPPGAMPPVRRGRASMTVQKVAGQSAVVSALARDPLKLLTPVSRGSAVWACLSSFGGGMVAGDQTELDLDLREGTTCYVGTQASTKVYRNPHGRACGHTTRATVGEGSCLVFAPDVVQAFSDSRYEQTQSFDLTPTSDLVLVDWLNAGRSECGEHWAFRRFVSRNEIRVAGKRRVVDALILDPDSGTLAGPSRLGSWRCLAMVALVGPGLAELTASIAAEVQSLPVQRSSELILSASLVREGLLLRIAGHSVERVRLEWQRLLQPLASRLGDAPWNRKG